MGWWNYLPPDLWTFNLWESIWGNWNFLGNYKNSLIYFASNRLWNSFNSNYFAAFARAFLSFTKNHKAKKYSRTHFFPRILRIFVLDFCIWRSLVRNFDLFFDACSRWFWYRKYQ